MRSAVMLAVTAVLALGAPVGAWALDCARVRALTDQGMRPSDVARELGITTPEVQACLAGVVDDDEPPVRPQQRVPLNLPGSPDELRREPNS